MPSNEQQDIVQEMGAQFGDMANIDAAPQQVQLPKSKVALLIKTAYLNRSQASNRKQLVGSCTVLECSAGDEFIGKTYNKIWGLETEQNIQYFKRDITNLELTPPTKPEDLITLCQQLTGICFDGSLVPNTDDQYPPNCFINRGARRAELEGQQSPVEGAKPDAPGGF